MSVIGRTNVIEGAEDDSYRVNPASVPVQTASVTLSAAQVHALNATPVDLLAAPGAGKKIAVLGVYSSKAAGAYAGGSAVTIRYKNTGNTLVGTLPATHFTASAADTQWATRAALSGTPAAQTIPTEGLDLNATAAFTGTGGDVTVTVRYVVVN